MQPSLRPKFGRQERATEKAERLVTRRDARRFLCHVESLPASLAEALWNDADSLIPEATAPADAAASSVSPRLLKPGDRTTIARIDAPAPSDQGAKPQREPTKQPEPREQPEPGGAEKPREPTAPEPEPQPAGRSLILKRYNFKGPPSEVGGPGVAGVGGVKDRLHTLVHLPLRSRACWSWLNGRTLLGAGLLTPAPLAYLEERRASILRLRSWLLTEFVAGRSLREIVDSGDATPNVLHDLALQFASIWRRLGQLRIGHGDMKATNFIVAPDRRLWLIDLDGMRAYRSALMLRRERRNDMARFMRNWEGKPEVEAIFRARIGTG